MSGRPSISAYTPSNTDPEILKRIFVQREKLLERIVDRLSRSMTTGDKHHVLLVGPRGSGKTHLVSLVEWDLQSRAALKDSMRIAWLGEDDSFTGLVHLAFGIANQLSLEYPNEFPADFKAPVRGMAPDDAALSVLQTIIEQLKNRSLLLITENMDQTFRSLGDSGQKKWRAFLQETRKIATLASAQQLFAGVSDRKEAFFGFFDIQHMQSLSVEQAGELIARISVEQSKPELANYLNSAEGRFRIRALHYLAGGNHRMYVLLAEFLTKDSLDDLVVAFESLAHDLTPYFQERMRSLPDQQRQLTQCLCDAEGALTVKQIAAETFIDERSCSKQLGTLKTKGYVRSEKRGKESYYDMAEPLMRLCLEIKNQRGRPLRLVARFLRAWFPEKTLQAETIDASSGRVSEYCTAAIQSSSSFEAAIADSLAAEINLSIEGGELALAKELTQQLIFANEALGRDFSMKLAHLEMSIGDVDSSIKSLTSLLKTAKSKSEKAIALYNRGLTYYQQQEHSRALADFSAVIKLDDLNSALKAWTLLNRGVVHGRLGDFERKLSDLSAVIKMVDAPIDVKARAFFNRGLAWGLQGNVEKEMADYTAIVQTDDAPIDVKVQAFFKRAFKFGKQGNIDRELDDYTAVIKMDRASKEHLAHAHLMRGIRSAETGNNKLALADLSIVIDMDLVNKFGALFNRGVVYTKEEIFNSALVDYSAVIEAKNTTTNQKTEALVNRGATYSKLGDIERALEDYAIVIEMDGAAVETKARALVNRGVLKWRVDEFESSASQFAAALNLTAASSNLRTTAMFALVEPMIAYSSKEKIITTLERAFTEGDTESSDYGGTPHDLLWMVLRQSPEEWSSYIAEIAPLYVKHDVAEKLGQGVTKSIQHLDEGGFSESQIDIWNSAWQKAGKDSEDLEIPLRCLDAAVEVMKSDPPTDRPLFQLPLEIRRLVRPMLNRSLGDP